MAIALVPSPPPRQPRYGLVASVGGEAAIRRFMQNNPSEGGPRRWEAGYIFHPDDCSSATAPFDPSCGIETDFTQSAYPDAVTSYPFGIWDSIKCSTFGGDMADITRRAVAKLETSTSHKVENELWTGTWAQATGAPQSGNQYLAKNGTATELNSGTAVAIVQALGDLQNAISSCAQGSRVMIHTTSKVATVWLAAGAIRKENGLLLDGLDNVIVAGSGYDGSAPDGTPAAAAATWAYATTVVDVRLSEIITNEYVDSTNNERFVIAQRVAAVSWDDCCLIGVNIDTTDLF